MADTISSRTPEGLPNRCPVCRAEVRIEPSLLVGDAPCPNCGQLLWFLGRSGGRCFWEYDEAAPVRERLVSLIAEQLGVPETEVTLDMKFLNDLGADSLDTVELIMELEDEFGIDLGEDDWPLGPT